MVGLTWFGHKKTDGPFLAHPSLTFLHFRWFFAVALLSYPRRNNARRQPLTAPPIPSLLEGDVRVVHNARYCNCPSEFCKSGEERRAKAILLGRLPKGSRKLAGRAPFQDRFAENSRAVLLCDVFSMAFLLESLRYL